MHVEAHRRCKKLFRMMRFEPRCLISQHSISRRMALVETIACKFVDQIEQFIRAVRRNVMRRAPRNKTPALRVHFRLHFFAHRTAQQICFTEAIASEYLRGLHYLFLIDENPVGFVQYRLKQMMRIFDGFFTVLPPSEHRNIVHRARTIKRHQRDDITEIGWFNRRQRAPHPFGFKLEHPDRLAALEQFIHGGIIMRQQVEVYFHPPFGQHLTGFLQH